MSIFDYFHKPENQKEPQPAKGQSVRGMLASFAANVEADKRQYPENREDIERIFETLHLKYKKDTMIFTLQNGPENAAASFFMSEDRLRAYACVFPPRNGGADVNLEGFLSKMRYEGITHGILQDEVRRRIEARDYLHIFPIAAGEATQDGKDGEMEELYARRPEPDLAAADEGAADFSEGGFVDPVGVGDLICRVMPPEPGHGGMDVTGQSLTWRPGVPAQLPRGRNTGIGAGGLALVAEKEGILYFQDGVFCVRPAKLIDGGVCGGSVPLRFQGDVYVGGDVSGGAALEASGSIFIDGAVRDARVLSTQGSIWVREGVSGMDGASSLRAAGQIRTPAIDNASVEAGGDLFAQTITNSSVVSGGTVSVLGGGGTIVGGYIQAMHQVVCQRIGSSSGMRCQIMVGCDPQIVAEWDQNHTAMADTQKVLSTLWENITNLRHIETRLNEEQKSVLNKLLEQRTLYEEKRDSLKKEREVLREQMKAARSGRVKCHELFPTLEIRLGERKGEVKSHELECDIHLRDDNAVLLR